MEAVIYTRVSRDLQNGRSVDDQERECRQECDRRGWSVRAVYCDNSISASRYGGPRPEWEKLKRELRQGDALVVWEASRSARDLEEFVALRNLCSASGVPLSYGGRVLDLTLGDDRFVGGLDALISERESEQIRVRVLRGKRSGALAGRPAGPMPWGYRRVGVGQWEPDPHEAPRIKEAVRRILAGESYSSVYAWITTSEGYTPSTLSTMMRSLRRVALAGFREHRGEIVGKGSWTPILTEAEHRMLMSRIDRSRKLHHGQVSPSGPGPKRLLSHIATCAKCGKGMAWRRSTRNGDPLYVCQHGHCSRKADPLDREIERRLFELALTVDPSEFEEDTSSRLWDEIESLEKRMDEWTDKAISDEISPESFAKIESGIKSKIERLRSQAMRDNRDTSTNLSEVMQNWNELPMQDRRAIVRGFFRIKVHAGTRGQRAGIGGVEIIPLS